MNFEKLLKPYFPKAKIVNNATEIVLEPKNNISFRIDNVGSKKELDCKVLEWLSRPSCKGVSPYWQRFMLRGVNSYFGKTWSHEDMNKIYTMLGNNVNRELCMKFIDSKFDLSVLDR